MQNSNVQLGTIAPSISGYGPPQTKDKKGRKSKYPFRGMNRGDSFFIACEPSKKEKVQGNITAAASSFAKYWGGKMIFITRSEPGGIRCYRTN